MLLNVEETGTNGHSRIHITDAAVVFGFAKEEKGNLVCLPVLAKWELPAIYDLSKQTELILSNNQSVDLNMLWC